MGRPLTLAALSLSLASMAWLAFVHRSRPAPAPPTTADALVPREEPRGEGRAARRVELLAPPELATVDAPRERIERSTRDDVDSAPLSVEAQLQALDQTIEQARTELDSLREVRVSTAVERAFADYSLAHSERTREIAAMLQAEGRFVDGAQAAGAADPSLIVVHRRQGGASSHVVIPREEFPELYAERTKLRCFAELSGIQANGERSAKRLQLSTLLDARARVAGSAR
jgi:hypothetical protein